ncbi:hypothetical protein C6361_03265 [Plantactinospora sp. BC1]|nr:hypothetical protein C6361_03265 [Plantactinospora sp. BC1]
MAGVLLRPGRPAAAGADRPGAGVVTTALTPSSADDPLAYRPVALVDLLDRVLATGVVISGDLTIAVADVELVRVSLRALVSSVGALVQPEAPEPPEPPGTPRPCGPEPVGFGQ